MKIRDLKAVIVDDAAVKSIHIERALQFCGVENIVMFDHQEALWEYLETSEADLIVTDMHYPLAKGEKENEEAGFILLEKMKQREHPIPVIICSSQNYRSPDALGTVWYNKLRDIEFDFKEIEKSLSELFPKEKISFEEVVFSFLSGEPGEMLELLTGYIRDEIAYEFLYSKKTLVYIILIAVMAAVFSNFAGAFQSRQISGISFYVVYMLLITLCLMSFRTAVYGISEKLESLTTFMRVLCPGYFLAVAFSSGSATSIFFYNLILFLIYISELVIVRFLFPVINVYIMVQMLGNLTEEDLFSDFADLLKKAVTWTLRTIVACIVGVYVVQGLLAPAIDTVKRSALTRTAEALPWIGNVMGGMAEVTMGTIVLIKHGIGMAGAFIAVLICAVPILQMLLSALLYKMAAAAVQPVSDKRITACIRGVSEGYEMIVSVIFTVGFLFLLTIAVVAGVTT